MQIDPPHFVLAQKGRGARSAIRARADLVKSSELLALRILGFQLPAVALPGITIVVSPLIALMKDQVDELMRRDIQAAALHSMASPDARRAVRRRGAYRTGVNRWRTRSEPIASCPRRGASVTSENAV